MDLLEYQAKKLFNQVGIPVLPSQPIHDPRELKGLHIPYPVVLKSQVSVGGRGRAGGIRFVENTIDAIAAARTIFNLPILNQYPEVILAEARYNPVKEFFLAIVLDYQLQKPVLLGSATGGIDVEKLLVNLQKVVIEDEFSPFYARRLVTKMGLKGKLIQSVSEIVEKMYYLFLRKDLDLIEINPLGVNSEGQLMALDGKISLNNHAISRHEDIMSLIDLDQVQITEEKEINITKKSINWLDSFNQKGNIALVSNSLNLALINWDLISQAKGKVAGHSIIWQNYQGRSLSELEAINELELVLNSLKEFPEVEVVLIDLMTDDKTIKNIAENLANYFQVSSGELVREKGTDRNTIPTGAANRNRRKTSSKLSSTSKKEDNELQFVLRLVGEKTEETKAILDQLPCYWTDQLEKAINETITLAS
jgi:succinyl-CoA synthetase beta subunit